VSMGHVRVLRHKVQGQCLPMQQSHEPERKCLRRPEKQLEKEINAS